MSLQSHFPTKDRLHTDVMEDKYGPIHAEVVRHDDMRACVPGKECLREARLVDGKGILRTYALTFLNFSVREREIVDIDSEIRAGGLIGKTFRKHGYTIKKNVIDVFLLDMPGWMRTDFQTASPKAKSRLTEFYAKKDGASPVVYGTVLEVYSPDFRDPSVGLNDVDRAQINPLIEDLIESGISSDIVWKRLDLASEPNEWDDMIDLYDIARQKSIPKVKVIRNRIDAYINTPR